MPADLRHEFLRTAMAYSAAVPRSTTYSHARAEHASPNRGTITGLSAAMASNNAVVLKPMTTEAGGDEIKRISPDHYLQILRETYTVPAEHAEGLIKFGRTAFAFDYDLGIGPQPCKLYESLVRLASERFPCQDIKLRKSNRSHLVVHFDLNQRKSALAPEGEEQDLRFSADPLSRMRAPPVMQAIQSRHSSNNNLLAVGDTAFNLQISFDVVIDNDASAAKAAPAL